ncbi:DNA phosphorothioation-associated protein 4 [Aliigemmobacter aestuarii]|uniref:DNA phosphorothioation-associated protein 4 n=1 Tax=Aliigemmobacter aestuarii TaxID=1445661 RepID=A0A4S3MM60_9RHOB|nr:DNA phosphorothioation-associated protein 4 [Gemmobacter aestuarii]
MVRSSQKSRRAILAGRVRRPAEFDDMLNELRESGVFATYKDALVFAAALGFRRGNRKSFKKSSEPIDLDIFRGDFDRTIMSILAIEETDDPTMIAPSSEDARVLCFEEYANGGLEIMKREIWDGKQDWRDGLLALVQREEEDHTMLDDITELANF